MKSKIENIKKNLIYGFGSFFIKMILSFIARKIFLYNLGVEVLGIDSVFMNIISLLSLAELGVGNAITYSLYKPLVENNKEKIKTLMKYYKKAYNSIGVLIILIGLSILPFLNKIISQNILSNKIYLIFLLYLANTSFTYFYSYKSTLLLADQKNYIVNMVANFIYILQFLTQTIVLILTKNFVLYLIVQIIFTIIYNLYISRKTVKNYPYLLEIAQKMDSKEEKKILKNIKATMIMKISGLLVNNTDNLIINSIFGITLLGKVSNYTLIVSAINSILNQLFTSMTSSVGHLNTSNDQEKKYLVFKSINFLNFIFFGIFSLGFIFLSNDFITLWLGKKYLLGQNIIILLGINLYMFGMQNTIIMYKNTMGLFVQGKYLLLVTAFINLFLSIYLGRKIGIEGVFIATLVARSLTNFWYHPYIVYKYGLKKPLKDYMVRYIKFVLVIIIGFYISNQISAKIIVENIGAFIIKGLAITFVNLILIGILFMKNDEVQFLKKIFLKNK